MEEIYVMKDILCGNYYLVFGAVPFYFLSCVWYKPCHH